MLVVVIEQNAPPRTPTFINDIHDHFVIVMLEILV